MANLSKKAVIGSIVAGASVLGGFGAFYANRAQAANGIENQKHVLVASIGYMGGKPAPFAYIWAPRFGVKRDHTNTVFLTFNDKAGCENARSALASTYRDEMFNSVCIVMPKNGEITFSKNS